MCLFYTLLYADCFYAFVVCVAKMLLLVWRLCSNGNGPCVTLVVLVVYILYVLELLNIEGQRDERS